jgi:spheroidene monooxygenase
MSNPSNDIDRKLRLLNGVVVVVLFDFLPEHRSWAWLKLMQGASGFYKNLPGLLFAKIMGSGEGGGFSLRPSSSHQGLIFLFDGPQSASDYLKSSELEGYRSKAREWWQGLLGVNSCRGSWGQQAWQSVGLLPESDKATAAQHDVPSSNGLHVASLTRGTVRATKALSFWRYAPAAQADLNKAQGCELSMGLGEAPVLRQCTFSLWKDTESMVQYAHQGAHMRAIAAAHKHGFFTESMFVRMQVLHMRGLWGGRTFDANAPAARALGLAS